MPPKSRGDYAFILHMLAVTRPATGRMAVVAPHGVLFRSGAEGKIREKLIRDNVLDAVVGLPAQLFPTTGIPVCIMVFDKAREAGGLRSHERDILFIDASRDFESGKKQNRLRDEDVTRSSRPTAREPSASAIRTRRPSRRSTPTASISIFRAMSIRSSPSRKSIFRRCRTKSAIWKGSSPQTREKMNFLSEGAWHRCLRLLPARTARRGRTLKLYLAEDAPARPIAIGARAELEMAARHE